MRRVLLILALLAVAVIVVLALAGEPSETRYWVAGPLRLETLVTADAAERLGLGPTVPFDVAPRDGPVVLHAAGRVVQVERRGSADVQATPIGDLADVSALSIDDGGTVWIVRAGRAGMLDGGQVRELFAVPPGGRLELVASPAGDRVYLFGREAPGELARGFVVVDRTGRVERPVTTEEPVVAVAAGRDRVFFATPAAIYALEGDELRLVVNLPEPLAVTSLAWDETNRVLLVATADAVFAMRGLVGVSITRGLGGIVRTRAGTLYVLDPARRVLVRITGLDRL